MRRFDVKLVTGAVCLSLECASVLVILTSFACSWSVTVLFFLLLLSIVIRIAFDFMKVDRLGWLFVFLAGWLFVLLAGWLVGWLVLSFICSLVL